MHRTNNQLFFKISQIVSIRRLKDDSALSNAQCNQGKRCHNQGKRGHCVLDPYPPS